MAQKILRRGFRKLLSWDSEAQALMLTVSGALGKLTLSPHPFNQGRLPGRQRIGGSSPKRTGTKGETWAHRQDPSCLLQDRRQQERTWSWGVSQGRHTGPRHFIENHTHSESWTAWHLASLPRGVTFSVLRIES